MSCQSTNVAHFACLLSGDLGVNSSYVLHEVNNTARVSPLVIIPCYKLDESWVEHDSGIGIESGGNWASLVVSGNKWLVAVSEESLHLSLSLGLNNGADLLVGGLLSKLACKVYNGYINGWYTESHTGKLALKGRNYLGYGLGGSGGGWDDVARGSTSSTPVLTGGGVYNSLGGGHGVNGGHESLLDVELVVDGLYHWCKTVGGTGSAGYEVLGSVVLVLVDTHNDGLGVILGRGGVDYLLGTSVNDGLGLLLGEENSGGLANVVSSEGSPAYLLRVTATGGHDLVSVKNKEVSINLNGSLGGSVDGVVLVLVGHVVRGGGTSVDGVQLAVLVVHDDTGDKTSDTSETVNSHSGGHLHGGSVGGGLQGRSGEG
mmetsp:Transcript_4092/g.2470  ORF Transcript_4092/g.2470 Transcript_4092/m.2470 type:complete len:373 (-) Transcript_4092:86-1204(-)